ncbi:DUF4372 domain-containing protein [Rhodoferax sp. AJA081-3]|nr:DUF4372 domain-containing protein [Rhodoferax sp. AJA081-3]
MAFAQLTSGLSLRDIEVNLRAPAGRLHHMGFRCMTIWRNTLVNAGATRPWVIPPIFQSDRGRQYCNHKFQNALKGLDVR